MDRQAVSNHQSNNFWDEYGAGLLYFGVIVIILAIVFSGNISSLLSGKGWDTRVATSCKDVTSYDHNWDNDMLCTRPDGSSFYTSYAGAREAEGD